MDLSHQPASGEVNAQHLITRANTVTAYITSRPFVAAKIKPSQHLRADQQKHHAHQPSWQMKMQSSLTIPSLTIHPMESSSIHSAPCAHQQLTTVANVPVSLDHHTYNQLTDIWVRQASEPQPFIKVTAAISISDYTAFGLTITKPTTPVTFSEIADTGCQSCLAGISTIHRLGMTRKDLIPVTLQMHAANNAKIAILGAAILQFSGQSNSGKTLVTHQLIYITDSTDKVFLSRDACIDLG